MQQPIEWWILAGLVLFLLVMPALMWSSVKDLFRHEKSNGSGSGIVGMMSAIDRVVNPAAARAGSERSRTGRRRHWR